ncbi:MAG: hypothetical protein ACE5K7_06445, partial [Phycisphaerae bacterium]
MQYLDILAPELVISVTAAVALILGVSAGRSWRSVAAGLSLVGLVLAIALTLYRGSPDGLWVAGIRIGWVAWNV